jgi:hypothetical protein
LSRWRSGRHGALGFREWRTSGKAQKKGAARQAVTL